MFSLSVNLLCCRGNTSNKIACSGIQVTLSSRDSILLKCVDKNFRAQCSSRLDRLYSCVSLNSHWPIKRFFCKTRTGKARRKRKIHYHSSVLQYVSYSEKGNKNALFVLQHCCQTSWKAMLRVLPPTDQTCLETNQAVAGCENLLQKAESRPFWVVNSFSSKVAKQVSRFRYLFYSSFTVKQIKTTFFCFFTMSCPILPFDHFKLMLITVMFLEKTNRF